MANKKHIEWLLEGAEKWNARREKRKFAPDSGDADLCAAPPEAGAGTAITVREAHLTAIFFKRKGRSFQSSRKKENRHEKTWNSPVRPRHVDWWRGRRPGLRGTTDDNEKFYVNLAIPTQDPASVTDTHRTKAETCANPAVTFKTYGYFAAVNIRDGSWSGHWLYGSD